MRALLDVNVLLALFDPEQTHHRRAIAWWDEAKGEGWASCPLTQNGFIRVISKPDYPNSLPINAAISVLQAQMALPDHVFWPDDLSIADPAIFDHRRLLGPNQLTDAYLLALAVENGGRLVTFDRSISIAAVHRAEPPHLVVL
jgi:toxin-antitoxin system PIN domain toxin